MHRNTLIELVGFSKGSARSTEQMEEARRMEKDLDKYRPRH